MKRYFADRIAVSSKIWALVSIALGLCALAGPLRLAKAAPTGSAISLSAEAGFQGHFRGGQWMPIRVSVANNGPAVSGQLRVVTGGTLGLATVSFSVPVELPTGSNKVLFVYAVFQPGAQQAQVDLIDASGVTLTTTSAPLFAAANTDALYVVVNGAPAGTVDLTAVHQANATAYQADWSIDTLPTQVEGWQAIDALLLTDTDTGKLSVEQTHALTDWVLNGGHLIVSGGPDWQKTRAGLTDLLPVQVNGTVTLDALDILAAFSGQASDAAALRGSTIVAQVTPATDARVLAAQGNTPLLVRRTTGLGMVDYLTFDPNLEPFRSWVNRPALWTALLPTTQVRPGWSDGVVNANSANDAAGLALGLNFPDVIEVAGFLGLYILLIGPLNYLVLRRLRRLEWAWFTIPVLIGLASVLAYSTGFNLRGSQPILSRLSIVQVWPDAVRARVDGVLGLASPRRALYDLALDQGMSVQALDPNTTNALGGNLTNAQIVEDTRYTLQQVPIDAGLTASFVIGGVIPSPALDGTATLQIGIDGRTHVQGQIHNGSDHTLTDSLVLFLNIPFPIGTLEPGESRSFTFTIDATLPAVISRGTTPSNSPGSGNSSPALLTELLNTGSAANAGQMNNLGVRAAARRQSFLDGVINNADQGAGRGPNVYFVGWSTLSPFGASLDGSTASYNAEDTTLYAVKLRSTLEPVPGQTSLLLAPGYFQWTSINTSGGLAIQSFGAYTTTPYNVYLSAGQPAAFQYEPLPGIQLSSVSALSVWAVAPSDAQSFLLLWDWQAGQWSNFNAPDSNGIYTLTAPTDLARFVGPGGTVRLQAVGKTDAFRFDRLDVALTGTLAGNAPPEATF
ncbi:MAG: DUF7408 domain-containing protein [Aggregatilineales bacterium]